FGPQRKMPPPQKLLSCDQTSNEPVTNFRNLSLIPCLFYRLKEPTIAACTSSVSERTNPTERWLLSRYLTTPSCQPWHGSDGQMVFDRSATETWLSPAAAARSTPATSRLGASDNATEQ